MRNTKTNRAIIMLQGKDSEIYTKLAVKLQKIQDLEDEAKKLKKEVKDETRTYIEDLFTSDDVIYTRVVETVSVIFTLSKKPEASTTPQYKTILEELIQFLTPELQKKLEELKALYSTTVEKQASLRFTRKLEFADTELEDFLILLRNFKEEVLDWANAYDHALQDISERLR